MQTRHRIPTIFNLSMVDVLCCALGCIILLWLVYFKEARERTISAGKTATELKATRGQLDQVARDLTSAQQTLLASQQKQQYVAAQLADATAQRDKLQLSLARTDKDYSGTLQALKDAEARITKLQGDLASAEKMQSAMSLALAQKVRESGMFASSLLIATQSIGDLEKQVGNQQGQLKLSKDQAAKLEQQLAGLKTAAKDTSMQLATAETRAGQLKVDLDKRKQEMADGSKRYDELLTLKMLLEQSLAANKMDLTAAQKDLAATRADLAKAQKELNETKLVNHGLVGDTKVLSSKLQALKVAADNRFAGIELTGRRVIFLIDMSGSMGMKDDLVEDPDKWPLLCEILAKLMQSLPELKQFQVILFSDTVRYPLASAGKWIDFQGLESVKKAAAAVLAMKPQAGTNMAPAFEETFRFRDQGLDTIYFLSDGLPNQGPGLPQNYQRLSETEKGVHLGKYIRDQLKTTWNTPRGRWVQHRVRINAVGFYFDSPDVGAFLWALARDNDGSFVGLSKP
jgi:von Willebrand factor type A domain